MIPTDQGLVHRKYSYEPLHRLAEGSYAFCGDPYVDYDEKAIQEYGREDLVSLSFYPPAKFDLSEYLIDESEYSDLDQEDIRGLILMKL